MLLRLLNALILSTLLLGVSQASAQNIDNQPPLLISSAALGRSQLTTETRPTTAGAVQQAQLDPAAENKPTQTQTPYTQTPVKQTTVLSGRIETNSPQEFLAMVDKDPLICCCMGNLLHNEFYMPLTEHARKRRWKRLMRTELLWFKRKSVDRAEFLAAACGMPLR